MFIKYKRNITIKLSWGVEVSLLLVSTVMNELITFALQERATHTVHTHKLRETCVALHEGHLSLIIALQKNS